MSYRRNAKKRKKPAYLPKKREMVAGCWHVSRELNAEYHIDREGSEAEIGLFEDQFSNLIAYAPQDGIYKFYYICPQCIPETFEDFYLEIYPTLTDITPENKSSRKKLAAYLKQKNITIEDLNALLKTHSFGQQPAIGDHTHICEHLDQWRVPIVIKVDDGFTHIEAIADDIMGEDIKQPQFLIFCPTCIAEWDPELTYEVVEEKTWNSQLDRWLKTTYPIFRTATEFFEWLMERLEDEEEDLEDYEYDGPDLGEIVLLCDHLDPNSIVEEAEIETIHGDEEPYFIPKTDISVKWVAACEKCTGDTDSPYQVAKSKTKNKQLHQWSNIDYIKLVIDGIGSHFAFDDGLDVEALVNEVCNILETPEQFFDRNSPVWQLALNWAPEFFDTQVLTAETSLGDEIKQAQISGEGWISRREKDPTTKENMVVKENAAVIFEDFHFVVIVTTLLAPDPELLASLGPAVDATGAVPFTITIRKTADRREFTFLFDNQFKAEEFADALPEDGEFDVDIIELEEE